MEVENKFEFFLKADRRYDIKQFPILNYGDSCGMCHWPKCERDCVLTPSVNKTMTLELNCEIFFV